MKTIFKVADNIRYISQIKEFENRLPLGIFSKKMTDVGGSYTVLNSPESYILVAPTRDLVDNKVASKDNNYPVFGVMGGTSNNQFREYIRNNSVWKIIVTFDSLPKLINWFNAININPYEINVCFDEFHLLLSEMGYRQTAIQNLISVATKFYHYTFLSATPISENFLTEEFKKMPYTELDWGKNQTIIPIRTKTVQPFKAVVRLIQQFNDGNLLLPTTTNGNIEKVEELFIFMNSVQGIAQVIKSAELTNDDVKVVCADTIKNSQILDGIEISTATGDNKRINFFTSKGFQGIDLFSTSGLVVVVSDASKKHTLISVENTLFQISGRLRSSVENKFKNRIWHFYSTGYTSMTEEEYQVWKAAQVKTAKDIVNDFNGYTIEKRRAYSQRLNLDGDFCYYNELTDVFEYSEMKEKFSDYNFELNQHIYKNGINIREAYLKAGIDPKYQEYRNYDDVVLKSIVTVSFQTLLEQYIELRNQRNADEDLIERYEKENPLFKDAYNRLGEKKINSLKFCKEAIEEALYSTNDSVRNALYESFIRKVGENNFISNADAKELLKNIASVLKIKGAMKVSDLSNVSWLEVIVTERRINGKQTKGIVIKRVK